MKHLLLYTLIAILTFGCSRSGRKRPQESGKKKPSKNINIEPKEGFKDKPKKVIDESESTLSTLSDLYEKYKNSVFMIYTSDGNQGFQGSGFFISNSGIAISNYHVFEGTTIGLESIKTHDGREFKINRILKRDKDLDYIVFKVDLTNNYSCRPIPISRKEAIIGEDVFAIGNPRGLESTLSKGIISGYREQKNIIQTTTEITHGSSGGPLINMLGQVIGITTSGLNEANLNFAINLNSIPLDGILR